MIDDRRIHSIHSLLIASRLLEHEIRSSSKHHVLCSQLIIEHGKLQFQRLNRIVSEGEGRKNWF